MTPTHIAGLPWYVTAYSLGEGAIMLTDGEHEVTVELRRHWRDGLARLESQRCASFAPPGRDPHLAAVEARVLHV